MSVNVIEIRLATPVLWFTLGAMIGLPWGYFVGWLTDPSHIWMRVCGTLVMMDVRVRNIAKATKDIDAQLRALDRG